LYRLLLTANISSYGKAKVAIVMQMKHIISVGYVYCLVV